MARIDNGNGLDPALLQPGFSVQSDGFGLLTSTCTFKADFSVDASATFPRGTAHPDPAYSFCKAHKWSVSYDTLNIATIKVDYVGIDPTINGGVMTNANTSVANGLTAENITTHPNFFTPAPGFGGMPLAGLPSDFGGAYDDSTLGPPVTVLNVTTGKPVVVPSSQGYNGACFETGAGGRFIG